MALEIVEYQETPNPNALKCVLSSPPLPPPPPPPPPSSSPPPQSNTAAKLRSYTSPEQAATDPLASAIFAIAGIRNVLIHDAWLTIGKLPEYDWKTIKSQLTKVLSNAS